MSYIKMYFLRNNQKNIPNPDLIFHFVLDYLMFSFYAPTYFNIAFVFQKWFLIIYLKKNTQGYVRLRH